MFTGLIEELGTIVRIKELDNFIVLDVKASKVLEDAKVGDSIAVDGVCLTATVVDNEGVSFDVMKETLRVTTLGDLKVGDKVNLERALRVGDRLGGHFVSGHVDTMMGILDIIQLENYIELQFTLPAEFKPMIVAKGSIAINGISLTLGEVTDKKFSVYLIPLTWEKTNLSLKKPGDSVNIEVDLLARYVLNKK